MCIDIFSFFFQAEDGIRDIIVTGVQTCALPIFNSRSVGWSTILGRQELWYPPSNAMRRFNERRTLKWLLLLELSVLVSCDRHTDLKIALPGLEEDQRREAGLRPHRLCRDGLHWPSHRRISGDVLSRRRCSVLGDRGTLDRQAPEGACRHRRTRRFAFG